MVMVLIIELLILSLAIITTLLLSLFPSPSVVMAITIIVSRKHKSVKDRQYK